MRKIKQAPRGTMRGTVENESRVKLGAMLVMVALLLVIVGTAWLLWNYSPSGGIQWSF